MERMEKNKPSDYKYGDISRQLFDEYLITTTSNIHACIAKS